ncbi:hypothetical protein BG262_03925 [Floricoccus penangensis]|uniref:HTH cro/C1-type domain-containing protein n=1 Tax=Floricoccus penangensis TaxID=1859475 RepID=A0A9Q5JFN1_9LACT|nr:cupin domain-containing protein [Floricoccus penangensis]OFI46170.1 hypothetical protein BG262_03925 [Floricoccus penangensis]
MDINKVIGENLNRIRKEKKMSMARLSELSGISKGMLSQIENGETNPTINTIWKICSGLDIPYTALFEEEEAETVTIIKKDQVSLQNLDDNASLYLYYGDTNQRTFELFQMEIKAGQKHKSVGHSLKSEEYIMVLEGNLKMVIDGKEYDLAADDAISFDANQEHTYINTGSDLLKFVLIIYYK